MEEELERLKNVSLEASPRKAKLRVIDLIENFVEWTEFKFITTKIGAHGPTKEDCLEYYDEMFFR